MFSKNEWDPLKKVIVGIADHATIPSLDISLRTVNYANIQNENDIPTGSYPRQVIEEANEDLEIFCNFLVKEGVEVVRPNNIPSEYYNYCPRDLVIVYKDKSLAAPMSLSARKDEYKNIEHHLENLIIARNDQSDSIYNLDCIGNPGILALTELYPKFDAANILRANDDLLYLVSNSGNKSGSELLKNELKVNVKLLKGVYSYMHIDSTVAFLREGLMLINPERIQDVNVLPKPFSDWDYILCPEPFDIGYYPGYCNASKWINMNLLSINPNLVVLEQHQHNLRKELERYHIECAMLPMRQQRTLGGGFHCVTLDLVRS
jgi:N-dimethylarginine dimethylaminohydrolase